jgi:hypothetical protein
MAAEKDDNRTLMAASAPNSFNFMFWITFVRREWTFIRLLIGPAATEGWRRRGMSPLTANRRGTVARQITYG